jgi:predicted metal-dependent phosphoesterase TrpH
MGFADLHIHSLHSFDGTSTVSAILKYTSCHTDLDVIALTDHDTISGVREAMDLAPQYGLEVIPGCEISTMEGHLLALFIDRPISAGLSLLETIARVADQGGLCIAAHPMARGMNSLGFDTIISALQHEPAARTLVGIESFNSGLVYPGSNPIVAAVSCFLPLAQTGNSDAHILAMIGNGSTQFAGKTALDLRKALESHTTIVHAHKELGGVNVLKAYLPQYLRRKLGWASWNAGPDHPVEYIHMRHLRNKQQMSSL